MAEPLRVDVWFDLICPWCLIGKRQFDLALARWHAEHPEHPVSVHWHGVQLVPGVPPGGLDFATFYERRLGSPGAVRARQAQVLAAAQVAGVDIDFSRIHVFPDTRAAHQLLRHAGTAHGALLDDLLDAYFRRGEDIGHTGTLLKLARRHGVDVDRAWADPTPATTLPPAGAGVPHFVYQGRHALGGAQAAAAHCAALLDALPCNTAF